MTPRLEVVRTMKPRVCWMLGVLLLSGACARRPLDLPSPDGGLRRDLAVLDLAARELSGPPDLAPAGGYCAGTKLADTCAQAFFQKVSACMAIASGCVQQTTPLAGTTFVNDACWLGGAQRHALGDGNGTQSVTWINAFGAVCMTGRDELTVDVLHASGAALTYDEASGIVSCPDGSTAAIGTMANGDLCGAVRDLLTVSCALGSCGDGSAHPGGPF